MAGFRTAIIVLRCSAMGAAALKMTGSPSPTLAPQWGNSYFPPSLDADCSGNSTCVRITAEISQSLSTTKERKLSDQEMDSLWNDGFVFLRGVLTNKKLLDEMGKMSKEEIWPGTEGFAGLKKMHASLNTNPNIRALVNDTNVRSLFEQLAETKYGSVPPTFAPMLFKMSAGEHHNPDEVHFGKKSPWGDTCDFHMDDYPTDVTDKRQEPASLTLWIAMSYSKAPLGLFRGSHANWGSVWGKCSNDTAWAKAHDGHNWCFDFDCTKEGLGENALWAADVEPGDMILFNRRMIHGGLQQETARTALTFRYPLPIHP